MAGLQITTGNAGRAAAAPEPALMDQVLDALETEYLALQARDAAALGLATAAKLRLLNFLDPRAFTRLPAAEQIRLKALLRRVLESNRRNGRFVDAHHAYVRARWAGLSSAAGSAGLYNAAGIARLPRNHQAAWGRA